MQQRLKQPPGSARARIVATELFGQLLVASNEAITTLDARLGREALATLARHRESSRRLR
jgi:hypothetical protein